MGVGMSEVGAVYEVEIRRAGGWLVGDHALGETTLHVDAAWDFQTDGGTLTIDEVAYEYTSVAFATDPDTGDDVDDEPAVIELSSGLEQEQVDGDLVLTFPHSETKVARVEARGFGSTVEARVPHALYDRLAEGIWGGEEEAPSVGIEPDGDGWVVSDIRGQEPDVDGSYIDPETMPPGKPAEPQAPGDSHAPVLTPLGPMVLRISVSPVENPTPVMYDFYVSPESPVVPSTATLLESTASSFTAIREWPDGTPLTAGEPVYCVVQTRSADQYGPVSAEGSGVPEQASGGDIEAGAITADHISAGSIDGDKLSGTVILGSDITTAEEGERHGLSADAGHYSYGSDGDLVFSARGGEARFSGAVRAKTFEAESASWSGQSVGTPGSSTMMGTSLQPPVNPPTVEPFYETITLDGADVVGDTESARTGLVWNLNSWWVATHVGHRTALIRFDESGSYMSTVEAPYAAHTIASLHLGGVWLRVKWGDRAMGAMVAAGYDNEWKTFDTPGLGVPAKERGIVGTDGDVNYLVWRAGGTARWERFGSNGIPLPGVVDTGANINPRAMLGGSSFGIGSANRFVIAGPGTANVITVNGNPQTAYAFPSAGTLGMEYREDTSQFYGLAGPRTIRIHPNNLIGEGRTVDLHAGYRWQDWDGEEHWTELGARPAQTFYQRAGVRLRTASPVPGDGGEDDPNGAAFYIGRSDAREKMELQPVQPAPGAGEIVKAELTDLVIPSGTSDAVNPPD